MVRYIEGFFGIIGKSYPHRSITRFKRRIPIFPPASDLILRMYLKFPGNGAGFLAIQIIIFIWGKGK